MISSALSQGRFFRLAIEIPDPRPEAGQTGHGRQGSYGLSRDMFLALRRRFADEDVLYEMGVGVTRTDIG